MKWIIPFSSYFGKRNIHKIVVPGYSTQLLTVVLVFNLIWHLPSFMPMVRLHLTFIKKESGAILKKASCIFKTMSSWKVGSENKGTGCSFKNTDQFPATTQWLTTTYNNIWCPLPACMHTYWNSIVYIIGK